MNKNILWLPSWYPDKINPYNGDFIQRHAKAAGNFDSLQVIYLVRDEMGTVTRDVCIEEYISDNVKEKIIYYYSPHFIFPVVERFFSGLKYRRIYKKVVSEYFQKAGKPDLVHVHIVLKAGIIAKWIRKKYKIPFLISEHWTGYLPEAKERISDFPFYFKYAWQKIVKRAAGFSAVSEYLGECIKKRAGDFKYKVIPNVIDTRIFYPALNSNSFTTQFIHISGLDSQKNPEGILKAFALLTGMTKDFRLTIVGPQREALKQLARELNLEPFVKYFPEMPQVELVKHVQKADALVLYSNYETFGCVLIEANACGVPVIVSNLKVFHETITDQLNGVYVQKENPEELAEKLFWFVKNREQFDRTTIAARAKELYNFNRIGKLFSDFYEEVLKKT